MSDAATSQFRALDAAHHIHPFTDARKLAAKGARVIVKGEGCWLTDSEGKRLLDGMAGLWCVQVGYGRKELAEAAAQAIEQLAFYNTFFQTTHPPIVELSAKLAELAPPGLTRAIYANSGSEANDTAIKLIRYFWKLQGRPQKRVMIARRFGYHGSTMAAASLTGLDYLHPQFDLPLPGFAHVAAPYWYGEGGDLAPEVFGVMAARTLEAKILELGAENVAAFFAEPIQGAGGVIIPPESYFPEIQRICREHDVLLVADEVICGFGRLGRWFGAQHFGMAPDLMTLAKGLTSGYVPMSALLLGSRIGEAIANADEELVHGFTYSGHPVAASIALANIALIEREKLVERCAEEIGPYFQSSLRQLSDHPLVGEVRGVGLIAAIELSRDKRTRAPFEEVGRVGSNCRDHCFELGLVMRAVRDTMVLSPPLIITKDEVDEILRLARIALDRTWTNL